MATYRWTGATNGTWTTSANWVNETGAAYSSGYPGSGNDLEDDVILSGSPTTQLEAKDASSLAKLRSLRVASDYDDMVGGSSDFLIVDCAEVVLAADAATSVRIKGDASIDRLVILGGSSIYIKGTIGELVILKGTVEFDAATTISTSLTIGSVTDTSDATVTIPNITSMCSTVTAYAGTVTCEEAVTTLNLYGATWTQAYNSSSSPDITTVTQNGGTMYWNGGNITTLYLYSGTFTAANGGNARRIGTAYVYPGGSCDLDNGLNNILVTSYVRSQGGTVNYAPGYDQAPYATLTYAGTSDASYGIDPQVLNTGGTASANGDAIYVGPFDRLDVYASIGAIGSGTTLTVKLQEDSSSSFSSPSDISGKSVTFAVGDGANRTKRITLWGYERTSSKPWIRAVATTNAASDTYVSAVYVHHVF